MHVSEKLLFGDRLPIAFLLLDTQLWRGLTGYHLNAKAAQQKLSNYFDPTKGFTRVKANSADNREHVLICLLDELDFLLTRDFKVIYNLFEWSMKEKTGFLLIGISNTMDLPERMSARLESFPRLFTPSFNNFLFPCIEFNPEPQTTLAEKFFKLISLNRLKSFWERDWKS
jgi:hypothetical protein